MPDLRRSNNGVSRESERERHSSCDRQVDSHVCEVFSFFVARFVCASATLCQRCVRRVPGYPQLGDRETSSVCSTCVCGCAGRVRMLFARAKTLEANIRIGEREYEKVRTAISAGATYVHQLQLHKERGREEGRRTPARPTKNPVL